MKIYDYSDDKEGDKKLRTNLINGAGIPDMSFSDIYSLAIFQTIAKFEDSVQRMDTKSYKPWFMLKIAVSLIADPGERDRLLSEMDQLYIQTLKHCQIKSTDEFLYPEKIDHAHQVKMDSFWFSLTLQSIPILGQIIQYMDRSMGLQKKQEIWNA